MNFDPATLDRRALNELITGVVSPRPIAWVSTIGKNGIENLAPFSFFNAFSFSPPTVAIGPGSRNGVPKDTLRNILETGEFSISVITEELTELANATSADFPENVSEWDALSIEKANSIKIRPKRVAASPAALECTLMESIELGHPELKTNSLVIGRVVNIYIHDAVLKNSVPRSDLLKLVARMGANEWCRTTDRFSLSRPTSTNPEEVRRELEQKK